MHTKKVNECAVTSELLNRDNSNVTSALRGFR